MAGKTLVELSFFKTPAATITTARKIIDITQCNLLFVNSYFAEEKLVLELESINHDGSRFYRASDKK